VETSDKDIDDDRKYLVDWFNHIEKRSNECPNEAEVYLTYASWRSWISNLEIKVMGSMGSTDDLLHLFLGNCHWRQHLIYSFQLY
jgi:hypothetical protein